MTLGILVNWLAGGLLAFTIFFYVVIYTMMLKRWTAQNIVIGGAAGALPPVVAWAAATGSLSVEPLLLFLIIFFWTPPHFWALALFRNDDYARAGVPMLPVVAGPDATRLQILLYTIVLVAVAVAPWPLGYFDAVYGVTSLVLGAGMLVLAVNVYRRREGSAGAARHAQAVRVLDPLSVRAVRDLAARGRRPCRRAFDLVGGAWRQWMTSRSQRESSSPRRRRRAAASVRSPSRWRSAFSSCCFSRSPWSRGRPCWCGRCESRWRANRRCRKSRPRAARRRTSRAGLTLRGLGRDAAVAAICGFVVVLMVGASYAAVPFYNWFCRTTGFNGTTQVATSAPSGAPLARKIAVRFDANVAAGLPWKFEPEQTEIEVKIGEVVTVFYTVTNQSARTTTGQAAYNVAPLTVGAYFQKINCFCFTEQTMAPGEKREMPVVFYVDPALVADSENDGLNTITLSYTFYPVRDPAPKPLAASEPDKRKGNL